MPGHRKRRQFKQTDAFTRGMVIGLKRAGWSIPQIAADTHLGASTVHRLWRRWLEQGNVAIYRNVGATRVTSARVDRRILRQAVAAPQATCTAILQHVQDTLDHSISTRTISRRLVANGLHSCRPLRRLPLTPPNRRQRLEWCRARSTWMTEWHRVVFSDESRFCLSSDSRRVRVWRRRGERSNPAAIVERPTVRQRGIMVWGAIAYDSRSPLLRIQGTMTAQRYVDDVLRPVTLPYLQGVPNALYQQDNARPHTARISQQALQDVQMLPWPPYSPDLSPIEHVWDIIGRRLHALPQPRSEDELWQMVEREWRAIPQDAIRTLIDSLPRRVAACIAVRAEENNWNNVLFNPTIMPPKRSAIGRSTNQAKRRREYRASETSKQSQARQERVQVHTALARSLETREQRQARQGRDRVHTALARSLETREQSQARQGRDRVHTALSRSLETSEQNQARQGRDRVHTALARSLETSEQSGKVKLPDLRSPPEPLLTLVSGETSQSKHFLKNIRKYNSCFQMTSFGATNIASANYMPTFKVQGQTYHHAGSLLPLPNAEHKYLQIYFMGNTDEQINRRCQLNVSTKREIVAELQNLFEQHNGLIKLFKTAIEQMPSDDNKVIIKADKTPIGQHRRQFNAPTIDEVAIVMVGEEFNSRDIILHRRNGGVQKVSAMNYYAYRMLILKCRQLFHQYIVDMYSKIESERLLYIRLNQVELRSEEYIHLRDAVVNDGNLRELGKMVILPSTFTGSPRHMHEYAQDAMTYVRAYGRPDFFITFTCNPAWDEIKELLLTGQTPSDRHDISAPMRLNAAKGVLVSTDTIRRRLHKKGLYARRPIICVPLTPPQRRARKLWSRQHVALNPDEWRRVMFTDESRFSLNSDSRRVFGWREVGTRNNPRNMVERDPYRSQGFMVWAGIFLGGRTALHIFRQGTLTGQRYRDEILATYVMPQELEMGENFLLMDDNARPHRAGVVDIFLQNHAIARMNWPARSPDLNPFDHVWDNL
ncbi:hypothetical protein LAZ67_6002284 [Cordylochernes scorpioides]|uniref:Transposase n=1 Tax=Cordylochernes scorpioides TaxID=51811 RepID=A0ABY6KPM3_9ARAC|nr:hypothetical protein LAZ67_6002284 [Cordylochernes scorpioides]